MRNALAIVLGSIILAAIGERRFWYLAQTRNDMLGRIIQGYLGRQAKLFHNYWMVRKDGSRDTLTEFAKAEYSTDELRGFGSIDYPREAGVPVEKQQRGLMLPMLLRAIESRPGATILEIGAANGDVLAWLNDRLPGAKLTGIDFSIVNAERKHAGRPIRFVKGYALHVLEDGERADLCFGSSTFCLFAPLELERYLRALRAAGVKDIVISEPIGPYDEPTNDGKVASHHFDSAMWFHNYAGYFRAAGYSITEFEVTTFKRPKHTGRVLMVWASSATRSRP